MGASVRETNPTPGILVVGDIMTDVIVKPVGPLARGSDRDATIRTLPGGSGANQAAWLAHFGVPTTLAARVGHPDVAHHETTLRAAGVLPRLSGDRTLPTGILVTLVDPDGERSFLTDRGANVALGPADLPESLLDGIGLLHVSGYALFAKGPRAAIGDLTRLAAARGIPLSVDPASAAFLDTMGPAAFLAATAGAVLCFPNEDEAAMLSGTRDEAAQRRLLARHYGHVVIKRGARGAEIVGPDGACLLQLPAPSVAVIDTTGAGDAFLAAYLDGHVRGAAPEACLRAGIAAGADATTHFGGRPPAVPGS